MSEIEAPTFRPALRTLILDALALPYTSVSGKESIQTGNHYQSVTLGDERTEGFRSDRDVFLDQLDFRGRRVLDLGSNLGEISRAARARGAAAVDGYDSDPFFVALAQAINAYNGTAGVSFFQRDITDPHTYRERYDIVLGFSVFTYIHQVLERIADITDEVLVVETHKLNGNLERDYLAPVRTFFPVHQVLGESDWGRSLSSDEKRAVIVFARDEKTLQRVVNDGGASRHQSTTIDVQRTALQGQFFNHVTFHSVDELLADIRTMEIDLARVANDPDLAEAVYSGKTYWLIFLKGYCQYLDGLILGRGNIYFDYIADYYTPRRHDPDLSDEFTDPHVALQRVAARFRDVDRFRQAPHSYVPTPITIFQTGDPERDDLVLYDAGSGEVLHAHGVDGWHRLFAARLFGAATVPAQVVETPTS